jgi:hypothetical protein
MLLFRTRKRKVPTIAALVAALVLIATEVFAGSNGVIHAAGSVTILN